MFPQIFSMDSTLYQNHDMCVFISTTFPMSSSYFHTHSRKIRTSNVRRTKMLHICYIVAVCMTKYGKWGRSMEQNIKWIQSVEPLGIF